MTQSTNLIYGLILAGGHSKRMGQDKSLLDFHGKPQVEHARDLLLPLCAEVFVSLRADQPVPAGQKPLYDLPQFSNIGPLGGILSAMTAYPKASWLVLACDLPFINATALTYLLAKRDPSKIATAFISAQNTLPEPLCAVWESHGKGVVEGFLAQGVTCPRKILIKSDPCLLVQPDRHWLDNINDPNDLEKARQQLKK